MTGSMTRRRFLTVAAAAAALPGAAAAGRPVVRWQGTALGADAQILIAGPPDGATHGHVAAVVAELERLERIFSLYRKDSALVRLNRDGRLGDPPAEMLDLLGRAASICAETGGAFDPTVQPLWRAHAQAAAARRAPAAAEIGRARRAIGWRHVRLSAAEIVLARPDMALTLNGIAQGYVTDRIADLLRSRGLGDVLVDMGETRAIGARPDGRPWQAAIARPDLSVVRRISLTARALATSAPEATLLDPAGRSGHILDPRSGRAEARWRLVSVSAPTAALADGLSTAFCVMGRDEIDAVIARSPGTVLEAIE